MDKIDLYEGFLTYSHIELRELAENTGTIEEKEFYRVLYNLAIEREERKNLNKRINWC